MRFRLTELDHRNVGLYAEVVARLDLRVLLLQPARDFVVASFKNPRNFQPGFVREDQLVFIGVPDPIIKPSSFLERSITFLPVTALIIRIATP